MRGSRHTRSFLIQSGCEAGPKRRVAFSYQLPALYLIRPSRRRDFSPVLLGLASIYLLTIYSQRGADKEKRSRANRLWTMMYFRQEHRFLAGCAAASIRSSIPGNE